MLYNHAKLNSKFTMIGSKKYFTSENSHYMVYHSNQQYSELPSS